MVDRVFSATACVLIKGYQYVLSPLMRFFAIAPSPCRYHPTCSHYALEAFRQHSFPYALSLAIRRILRCRPFARGGYDPVPPPSDQ
ncbi:MAG: membrane protein insertion efficiency factor YidD [Gemmatimonadota bacterium]|nr:membrane protein insertion efficiency factor YidD [Gemmatimonadota bacterium]